MHTHQTRNVIPPEVQINNCNVEIANGSRILGVEICETMNWSAQCEKVANKLRSVTYMFTMLTRSTFNSSAFDLRNIFKTGGLDL